MKKNIYLSALLPLLLVITYIGTTNCGEEEPDRTTNTNTNTASTTSLANMEIVINTPTTGETISAFYDVTGVINWNVELEEEYPKLVLDDGSYLPATTITDYDAESGTFSYKLDVSLFNGAGNHNISVYALDLFQNSGTATVSVDVQGVSWLTEPNLNPMDNPRYYLHLLSWENKLYAVGGQDALSNTGLKLLEEYDIASDTWSRSVDMTYNPAPHDFASAVVDAKIYLFGGILQQQTESTTSNAVKYFDIVEGTWSGDFDVMPTSYVVHAASAIATGTMSGSLIYLTGGISKTPGSGLNIYHNDLWTYNPLTQVWSSKEAMDAARSEHASCYIDGKLFVAGGQTSQGHIVNTLYKYDPNTDTWASPSNVATMNYDRCRFTISGVSLGPGQTYLYAVGGFGMTAGSSSATELLSVEEYSVAINAWTDVTATKGLPFPISNHGGCTDLTNQRIWIAGGFSSDPTEGPVVDNLFRFLPFW